MADKLLDAIEMRKLKEDIKMSGLMQMLMAEGRAEGRTEGLTCGIVETYKELGLQKKDATEKIMQKFGLSEEEAGAAVEEYWN